MSTISDLNQLRYSTDGGTTTEPPEGKKDTGFVVREVPASATWNWSRNKSFERFKSLQGYENHLVIGDVNQKTNFVADLLLSELLDAAIDTGDKIVFLDGTHTLAGNKTLSDNDLEFMCQSAQSQIDLNGFILTLSGDRLRGQLNITNTTPVSVIVTGAGIEHLKIRIDDPSAVDFNGTGSVVINGEILNVDPILAILSNQPDKVVLTASQQSLYANDNRFVRYDQSTQTFKRRDGTVVPIATGDWIVINELETLTTDDLLFVGDRLRINSHRGFQLNLGDQGDNIPYGVIVIGNNCDVSLHTTQSMRELGIILGDDKFTPMSNGLTAMENRRVIKNQGELNRIKYNGELIFSGGPPQTAMDFVRPNHPYLLEWDSEIYQGLLRHPTFDNRKMCFFSDMYYWLDRRFNAEVPAGDPTLVYHTVTAPPRIKNFLRPIDLLDLERHRRVDDLGSPYLILSGEYTQVSDKIILGGNPNAADNIRNVKNGQRVQATGLPDPLSNTTIVRPGSIVITPGVESFLIMDAEDKDPVTAAASGDLTLDFSGMAAGSHQDDALQDINGAFVHRNPISLDLLTVFGGTGGAFEATVTDTFGSNPSVQSTGSSVDNGLIDFDASRVVRTAAETRTINSLVIPYYRL